MILERSMLNHGDTIRDMCLSLQIIDVDFTVLVRQSNR